MSGKPGRAGGAAGFRRVRIGILLCVLAFTAAWAAHRAWQRRARADWDRPLQVGVVLLSPRGDVDLERWRPGISALSARFDAEMARWRGPGGPAFEITLVGPVRWTGPLPFTPASGSPLDRARHAFDVWRTLREVDRAADGTVGGFDVRVLLLCDDGPGAPQGFAEGSGAVGGEVGFVRGACAGDLSLPLQAVGHELLHMVGASDKYDAGGHARAPDGLAEPGRVPRYPQVHAEWMVGEVPLEPGRGRLPESLEEVRVGEATAREIGWIR
jgi:hypothetical protein